MISIALTAGGGFIPRAIRWFTSSKISHARIGYDDATWGGRWVMQATWPQIQLVPQELAGDTVVAEFQCLFDAESALKKLRGDIGANYNVEGILALGWVYGMWKVFRKRVAMPKYSNNEQFCSELVARLFQAAGLLDPQSWNVETVTPELILEYCEKQPKLFKRLTPLGG